MYLKTIHTISLLLLCCTIQAQNFRFKAMIKPVPVTGFYNIPVSSAISAHSNIHLQDIRLFDNEGKEVPYLLKKEQTGVRETGFIRFPFRTIMEPGKQILVIENKDKSTIDRFFFEMKNADASRTIRISGSENENNWYVVKDSLYFESYTGSEEANVQQVLHFPGTDYAYYLVEIAIKDGQQPLNIIQVGHYNTNQKQAKFRKIEGISYTRVDSNKTTYLRITCNPANRIDRFVFHITAPEMFRRDVVLKSTQDQYQNNYTPGQMSGSKYKRLPRIESENYELSSEQETAIDCENLLGNTKSGNLTFEISNKDNEALQITGIDAYQLTNTITAKLEKGKSYFFYFGDSLLSQPSYDLIFFEKQLPEQIATIEAMEVQPKYAKTEHEYDSSKDRYIVWIGLGIVGIIILFLTLNMMKKMKK